MHSHPQTPSGVAKRHEDWDYISEISGAGRATLDPIPNYRLTKAATRAAHVSAQARLLLVHLIGYLGVDQLENPSIRFVAFPGNTRLSDELGYSKRSIQRLADELEEKGLMRRCYNGLNRRVGFDLTPLAMQHDVIEANIIAIQTQRKLERNELQLELSLAPNQICRPERVSNTSSQGDRSDIHNSSTESNSADEPISRILDSVDPALTSKLSGGDDAQQDRTDEGASSKEAFVLRHLTGSGRAAHIGWTMAKRSLGFDRALALCAIAENDPKRRASTDRYFSWLFRMISTGDGQEILSQAAGRAATKLEKVASGTTTTPSVPLASTEPLEAVAGEDHVMLGYREAIRSAIGSPIYASWFGKASLSQAGDVLTISATTPFAARWIEDNLGEAIEHSVQAAATSKFLKVEFRVA